MSKSAQTEYFEELRRFYKSGTSVVVTAVDNGFIVEGGGGNYDSMVVGGPSTRERVVCASPEELVNELMARLTYQNELKAEGQTTQDLNRLKELEPQVQRLQEIVDKLNEERQAQVGAKKEQDRVVKLHEPPNEEGPDPA